MNISKFFLKFGIYLVGGLFVVTLVGCPKEFSYHPQDPNNDNESFDPPTQTPTQTPTITPILKKRVFVSSLLYDGTFDAMPGITGADQRCQELAAGASPAPLGGQWVAFLTDDSTAAKDRVPGEGPWYLVDKVTKVFETRTGPVNSIFNGGPLVPIDKTEHGFSLPLPYDVWTGSLADGGKGVGPGGSEWCSNWTASASNGFVGNATVVAEWSKSALPAQACASNFRIYCFEK